MYTNYNVLVNFLNHYQKIITDELKSYLLLVLLCLSSKIKGPELSYGIKDSVLWHHLQMNKNNDITILL